MNFIYIALCKSGVIENEKVTVIEKLDLKQIKKYS